MSKRRLSKRQSDRIRQRRSAESVSLSEDQLGDEQEGIVITHLRNQAEVQPIAGGSTINCHLRANLGSLVAGDRVLWQPGPTWGVVNGVFPRETEIKRPDAYGKLKLIAANVEQMIITLAPEPTPFANLIDRYLILAASFNIRAILVLNKSDLLKDDLSSQSLIELYEDLGYQTLQLSAKRERSLSGLKALLSNTTSIFVGQSGVGKSSIVQALLPNEAIKIGDLSTQAKKGRHTTTHAKLYNFEFGGRCIDSPGIRELGLWHLSREQVVLGFPEFASFVERCRFRNCQHDKEPGCALLDAVENNWVSASRFASYKAIIASLEDVTVHSSPYNNPL